MVLMLNAMSAAPSGLMTIGVYIPGDDNCSKWLKENLGITATLHDGFFLDPTDDAGDSNLYKLDSTGKYISHEETMAMIKDFLKDK